MLEHEHEPPENTRAAPFSTSSTEKEIAGSLENAVTSVRAMPTDNEAYVAPLLANLRKLKRLRPFTEAQLRTEAATAPLFLRLQALLNGNAEMQWREKILATWALSKANLDPYQKQFVVNQLHAIIGKQGTVGSASWLNRISNAIMRLGKWVIPAVLLFTPAAFANAGSDGFFFYNPLGRIIIFLITAGVGVSILLSPFVVPYSLMVDADHYHEVRAAAVRALRTLGGVESLSVVTKMTLESSPMTSGPARGTLAVLLTQLTSQHYGTLPSSLLPDLCRVLKYEAAWLSTATENHTLALRVVEAFEKIGDGRTANVLEKLLKGSLTPQLKQAMEAVLPTLIERRNQENAREMLLRHASMPPASPEELLRPAGQTTSDPNTLVRPTEAPPEPEDETP